MAQNATSWKVGWPVAVLALAAVACSGPADADPDPSGPDGGRPAVPPVIDVVGEIGDGCGLLRGPAVRLDPPVAPATGRVAHAGPVALPVVPSGPLARIPAPPRRGDRRAGDPDRVVLRLLVMIAGTGAPSETAARAALDRLGVPYDVFDASQTELTAERLQHGGVCLYRGVILSEANLAVYDEDRGQWASSLSDDEWQTLAAFERACAAREIVWYAYPQPAIGLSEHAHFESDTTQTAALTEAGAAMFPYVRADAAVPIAHVWGYRGQVLDPEVTTPLLTDAEGYALAALHRRPDGTEVVALTVDSSAYSTHAQLLEFGLIDWVSRGLFLGQRRTYLGAQIDDVFLATEMWVPGQGHDPNTTFRIEPDDVLGHVAWQDDVHTRLPSGSSFVTQLAFNGNGTLASLHPDTALVDTLRTMQDQFQWINHTWDHTNMNAMSRAHATAEIADNCDLAATWDMPGFSCAEVVTPQISGLDNPEAVAGMIEAGVRVAVSDTSMTAQYNPDNPGDNPSHNTGRRNPSDPRLFQVPRHPTNIFYNCSTVEEELDMYNALYAEYFGRELSYDELLDEEARLGLYYLLSYDADPLMFHQANLRTWTDEDGRVRSLYIDWIERVLERFGALVELPVLTLTLTETADLMKAREAYDGCGAVALLVRDAGGDRLELSASRRCTVPITGVAAPGAGRVEHYAGVPTTFVQVDACAPVVVPVP